jgi:hypothetical protein
VRYACYNFKSVVWVHLNGQFRVEYDSGIYLL